MPRIQGIIYDLFAVAEIYTTKVPSVSMGIFLIEVARVRADNVLYDEFKRLSPGD